MAEPMMLAARLHDYAGPDGLVLEQVPRPKPAAGQVLIRVKAAGVNPADWKIGGGAYKQYAALQFPWTPGLEVAGVIEAVGPDVSGLRKGQDAYGAVSGGYAEYVLAKAEDTQPKPASLTFEEAASVPVGALTAWGAITAASIKPDQHVLVHGGAGGVGGYAVQLARWKGAHVSATASAANLDFMRSLGAESVIDYNAAPFETAVHALDAVLDTVGGELAERSFKVLRPDGIYVTVAGRLPEGAGKAEGVRAMGAGRASTDNLHRISELLESRKIRPLPGKMFSLKEAWQAQELSKTGHGRGRIILRMGED